MSSHPSVTAVLKRVRKRGGERANQSDLFRWLSEHHAEFAAALPSGQPGWRGIAIALTESGLAKSNGAAITADYARQTWWKVRRKVRGPIRTPAATRTMPGPQPRLVLSIASEPQSAARQFPPAKIKE